jgi:4-hydroxybutyrate CoA-transferase
MDFREEYKRKLMSADEAVKMIPDHSLVSSNVAVGCPTALVNALVRRKDEVENIEFFYVVDVYGSDIKYLDANSGIKMDLGYPVIHRKEVQEGRFCHTPVRFGDAARAWKDYRSIGTTLHLVTPMDKHGYFCMGLGADYNLPAARLADKIIVQVSSTVPRTFGENYVHISQVDAIVEEEHRFSACRRFPPITMSC